MSGGTRFPELGDLKVLEVYEFYDEPVLFAARNERDSTYLVTLVRDDDERRRWLYAPMSARRFQEVRSGGVDLYMAFRAVEGEHVFAVDVPKDGSPASGTWALSVDLDEAELPEPGECLALPTATASVPAVDPVRAAHQAHKEVMTLHFHFRGMTRTEAPAGLFGQLLDNLQQLVFAVGQFVRGTPSVRGGIPRSILSDTTLGFAGVFPSSFGVELHADRSSDLFGWSPLRAVLEQLFRLLEATASEDNLLAVLSELKGRSGTKYRQFLIRFAGGVQKVEIRWGSPSSDTFRTVTITDDTAEQAVAAIGRMRPEPPSEFEVTARLVGINVRTKTYEIWDVSENQKFSGRIHEDAMPSAEHATVNELYVVQLREETVVSATGEPETKYRLLQLSAIDGAEGLDEEPAS